MPRLTSSQLSTLKTSILANTATVNLGGSDIAINDPNLGLPDSTAAQLVANWYNGVSSPNYWVFKATLARHDYTDPPGVADDGSTVTAFVWGGATGGYISRSQGERDAFRVIFNATDNIVPARANVRTAFDDIFSGAGAGAAANRAHFRATARKLALIGEKLFAVVSPAGYTAPVQSGNRGTTTNPDTPGVDSLSAFISTLTGQDIKDAYTS